jgi:uncharacterized protein YutE (UPF0331/DUF86 family)
MKEITPIVVWVIAHWFLKTSLNIKPCQSGLFYGKKIMTELVKVEDIKLNEIDDKLIPAAKQRAIDLAEQLKAEAEQEPKSPATAEIVPINTGVIAESEFVEVKKPTSLNDNIIAMYAALNPELHKQVVELAGQIDDFIQSEQQSSFLTRLFNLRTKSGQELKQAFITVAKSLKVAA